MIRYFYSMCFLVFGMGLPLLAKSTGTDRPTPSTSSKAADKSVLPPRLASSSAKAKENAKKNEVTVTPDVSRGSVSSSLLAKQEADSVLNSPLVRVEERSPVEPPQPVIRNSTIVTCGDGAAPLRTASGSVTSEMHIAETRVDSNASSSGDTRLARVTAYWAAEGDYYTERCMSSTGVRLHDGHCAVDPSIIPYGSVVQIDGVGKFLAVDTGSAVISRTAAREGGHTAAERHAIVVDVFFEDREEGERFAAGDAKYINISWWTPTSVTEDAKAARSLFAEEDWTKIQSKQL